MCTKDERNKHRAALAPSICLRDDRGENIVPANANIIEVCLGRFVKPRRNDSTIRIRLCPKLVSSPPLKILEEVGAADRLARVDLVEKKFKCS